MDNLVLKQKRVKFPGPGPEKQEESEGIRERREPPSFKQNYELQRRFTRQYFSSEMNQDYDARESEFATAVAAAAFAVYSIDQVELQYQKRKKESLENSRTRENKSRKGEASRKSSVGLEHKVSQRDSPTKQPSQTTSVREAAPANRYQTQKGISPGGNDAERRADSWETAQMKRVQDRYDKTKSAILDWENEKKRQAKLKMEKKKSILEQKRGANMQHYQNKIARTEQIAGGARAQLEEKRKKEELAVKDKAKKIKSRGKVPVRCFCFTC